METLSPVTQRFILHWGEMGPRWGVNRTVAQVHALLFLSPEPLTAERIAETLGVARSNVSTCLRDLQGWGIVRTVPVLGDRRVHFESMKNVWEMFLVILQERRRREIDPTLAVLRECMGRLGKGEGTDKVARERLGSMLEFFETVTACSEELARLPAGALRSLAKLRGKVRRLLK